MKDVSTVAVQATQRKKEIDTVTFKRLIRMSSKKTGRI
jgi:hypothetical protein